MAKYTKAQARSSKKYLSQFAEIRIRVFPEQKKRVEESARNAGKSMQGYVWDAVDAQMGADTQGAEIPPYIVTSLMEWLKNKGHSETEILDCLTYLGKHHDK